MRELADEGLTTREACGNSVRNITGCPYAGTSENEIFDPTPYAEATDTLLPAPSAERRAASQVQDRVREGAPRITRSPRSTTSAGARASWTAARAGKMTVAGGTSILPVNGYVLYDFLPVEEMLDVAEAVRACLPQHRRLQASAARTG